MRDLAGFGLDRSAHELLTIAEMSPLSGLQHARVARLRAQMEFARSRGGGAGAPRVSETATPLLDAARRQTAAHDVLGNLAPPRIDYGLSGVRRSAAPARLKS